MAENFPALFADTNYQVRLPQGGCATIHIGARLPTALRAQVGARPWSFITAWNPRAQHRGRQQNRIVQRQLLEALRALPPPLEIIPAIGVGRDWRESSLFVIGPSLEALDALARQHEQVAYVHGEADGEARLRWMDP